MNQNIGPIEPTIRPYTGIPAKHSVTVEATTVAAYAITQKIGKDGKSHIENYIVAELEGGKLVRKWLHKWRFVTTAQIAQELGTMLTDDFYTIGNREHSCLTASIRAIDFDKD